MQHEHIDVIKCGSIHTVVKLQNINDEPKQTHTATVGNQSKTFTRKLDALQYIDKDCEEFDESV